IPAMQSLGGFLQCLGFECAGRVAGHSKSAPNQFSGFGIVGGNADANAELRSRVSDENQSLCNARCTSDGVGLGLIDGDDVPDRLTGFCVERDEPAVECAEKNFVVV